MGRQPDAASIAAAQAAMVATKVPASISLAQYALESAWGERVPLGSNNPFGIKAVGQQAAVAVPTHEWVGGRFVATTGRFAVFPSLSAAFLAHARLLSDHPQYAPAMEALPDIEAFCDHLTGVYATDPEYGTKLIEIINGSDLTQYDTLEAA